MKIRLRPLASALAGLFLLLPLAASAAPAPFPDPKDEAAWPGKGPIRVHPWMKDNREWFWSQREKDKGAVVFVGDSLTGGWKNLGAAFPGLKVANRGIGGDTSRGVLFRFKEDVLDLQPAAIVINIGTNDLSAHGDPAAIGENIRSLIAQARAQRADVPIIVCTIPPRDHAGAPMKPGALEQANRIIRELGKPSATFEVLDLFALYAGKDGKPAVAEQFTDDRLHLAAPGYQVWADAIKPVFTRLGIR